MLKVAIVGCGTMGGVHGRSYMNIKNAKVVAVCDINEDKGSQIAKLHNAKNYNSYDEMLNNEDIDIVDICVPTYMHREFAEKALKMKKHVFCEKPIALNIKDAEFMVRLAEEMGVKFSVGHVVRFFPAYTKAIEAIDSKKIGTPKLIRTTRTGAYPSWNWNNWYSNYDLSGGPILDLVIHDLDWIRHNFGEVERVYAKSFNGKVEGKDHCLITLKLKNGSIAHVEGSWAFPQGATFGTTFEVIGTKGQVEFDSRRTSSIKKQTNDGSYNMSLGTPLSYWDEPYTKEIQCFIDCIIEDKAPYVTGKDAIEAVRISLAAIKSSKEGKSVTIGG